MKHSLVSGAIALVVFLFTLAAMAFAMGTRPSRGSSDRPPAIPQGMAGGACTDCHVPGAGPTGMPATHRAFRPGTCPLCHGGSGKP